MEAKRWINATGPLCVRLFLFYSDQCEELRPIISKMNQDEVCKERAQQLKLKAEQKKVEAEGKCNLTIFFS